MDTCQELRSSSLAPVRAEPPQQISPPVLFLRACVCVQLMGRLTSSNLNFSLSTRIGIGYLNHFIVLDSRALCFQLPFLQEGFVTSCKHTH